MSDSVRALICLALLLMCILGSWQVGALMAWYGVVYYGVYIDGD